MSPQILRALRKLAAGWEENAAWEERNKQKDWAGAALALRSCAQEVRALLQKGRSSKAGGKR